jgi:hypothetical protein
MDFLKNRLDQAAASARAGDSDQTRRILDHAVAEDPDAIRRIGEALKEQPDSR